MSTNSGPLELIDGGNGIDLSGVQTKPEVSPAPTAEELLARMDAIGVELRSLIVLAKRIPRINGLEPHQDSSKSLATAQSSLQTGFMWLRRAIEQPKIF